MARKGKRLNQERQHRLEPQRIEHAIKVLEGRGYTVIPNYTERSVRFEHLGATVIFWPYSGWFTGRTVNDGRGLQNLLHELRVKQAVNE